MYLKLLENITNTVIRKFFAQYFHVDTKLSPIKIATNRSTPCTIFC